MAKLIVIKKACNHCGGLERYASNRQCPVCHVKRSMKSQAANRTAVNANSRKWRKANKTKVAAANKKWNLENPELRREHTRVQGLKWQKAHPGQANASTALRRARRISATPTWADDQLIEAKYKIAAWCSKHLGEEYHVDHIIPLQGKEVCGLHVDYNLRVITAKENRLKSNKL